MIGSKSVLKLATYFLVLMTGSFAAANVPPISCEQVLSSQSASSTDSILSSNLGIDHIAGSDQPMQFRVVDSKFLAVKNAINSVAHFIVGKAVNIKALNKVTVDFLADKSADPYFVKLARAFQLKYTVDLEALEKLIPKTGPVIITANHPRNGSEAIALAAAISKVRPDLKVAINMLLENYPGLADNAIFLNSYGGEAAVNYNRARIRQMHEHLAANGLLIIFASGDVSVKAPGSSALPADLEWRNGVAAMVAKFPHVQIVPTYIGGQASNSYYKVRRWGIGLFTTIFNVREMFTNIGADFPITFSPPILGTELLTMFGDGKIEMMRYLRARTYAMAQNTAPADVRLLEEIPDLENATAGVTPEMYHKSIRDDLDANAKVIHSDASAGKEAGILVYLLDGKDMSDAVLAELGRSREEAFRSVGEGSGKPLDVDEYDSKSKHFIAIDAKSNRIIGAYRLRQVDQAQGPIYTSGQFAHQEFLRERGYRMVELSRSFVNVKASPKSRRALQNIWKGITNFLTENPQYRYLIGAVSISNAYSPAAKYLMLSYLRRKIDPTVSKGISGYHPIDIPVQFKEEIELVASRITSLSELNKLVVALDGKSIPLLLYSYDKFGGKYLAFDFDKLFNSIDGLILVDLLSPEARAEAANQFGENWTRYREEALKIENKK